MYFEWLMTEVGTGVWGSQAKRKGGKVQGQLVDSLSRGDAFKLYLSTVTMYLYFVPPLSMRILIMFIFN